MEWLFQTENLRLRQNRESERLFKKKKKKDSDRRETLPLPTPWVKLPKREVRAWNLATTHAVTPPPRESGKTHLADPHDTHTHHATPTSASVFTLKYLIYSLKSQNLCFLCLCFYLWGICACVIFFFFGFLALWLCDYLTDESVFVFVNCDSVQLYYIDKRESRVSRY